MHDLFICTDKNQITQRNYLEEITFTCLKNQVGFNYPRLLMQPFLERYFEAERQATSDIYILCDNDILLPEMTTLLELVNVMLKHPDYSQIGLAWKEDMSRERDSTWKRGEDGDVWEFDHAGGCVAIRKGTIQDFKIKPEHPSGYGDDRVMGETARRQGYKVGIAHQLPFIHLGAKYSSYALPKA